MVALNIGLNIIDDALAVIDFFVEFLEFFGELIVDLVLVLFLSLKQINTLFDQNVELLKIFDNFFCVFKDQGVVILIVVISHVFVQIVDNGFKIQEGLVNFNAVDQFAIMMLYFGVDFVEFDVDCV